MNTYRIEFRWLEDRCIERYRTEELKAKSIDDAVRILKEKYYGFKLRRQKQLSTAEVTQLLIF